MTNEQMKKILNEVGANPEVVEFAEKMYSESTETYETLLYYYTGTDNFTAYEDCLEE